MAKGTDIQKNIFVLMILEQWFSTFLILKPFNAVPHIVGIINHVFYCSFIEVILLTL